MVNSKLIILEGLMGSGKSSTAVFLALQLQGQGIPYRYYWEGEKPHPLKVCVKIEQRFFDVEELVERSLLQWRAFVADVAKEDRVTVLDGQLFHVNVTRILKQNGTREQMASYVRGVDNLTRRLHPRLIYFYQHDVETALQKVGEERGERWLESHVREKVDSAFGRENTLAGFAGLVRFCEVYRSITDDLFAGLQMAKLLRASPILFEFDLLRAKCIGGQCAFAVGWR